jgi:hypothetical protein
MNSKKSLYTSMGTAGLEPATSRCEASGEIEQMPRGCWRFALLCIAQTLRGLLRNDGVFRGF